MSSRRRLPQEAIKIGAVARQFDVSPDLLRVYEKEGLLIPLRSPYGTRYYTERDYPWIGALLRLIREEGLGYAAVRRLLAALPCWRYVGCPDLQRIECPVLQRPETPCWAQPGGCGKGVAECYFCAAYRAAPECEDLRQVMVAAD